MRLLNRNKQPLWYANFADKTELIDEWGNSTGQYELTYSNPVKAEWNVNTVDSDFEVEMFGVDAVDTIVMVVKNDDLPLTETSILWYDVTPNIKQDGTTDTPHNYRIIGIRKSLNFTKVYAKKVSVTQNVGQGIIDEWHVYQDFEEAYNESDKVIIVPNLAKSNDYIVWNQNTTRTQNFYTIVNGDAVNTTKYIKGVRKSQIPIEMTIDTHDSSGNPTPSPVTGSGKLVYFDMRMKRVSLSDDPVTLKLMDSSNNEIFNIYFPTNSIPQLVASQTYGAVTSDPALTDVTYPFTEDWVYLRAIIDFDSKTFKLYQGATMDTMVPFVEGTTTFTFKNTNASNVYKFYTGYKGVYAYDDVNVYTVGASGSELPTEVSGGAGAN